MSLFRLGQEPASGKPLYHPISATPLQRLAGDPYLAISGSKELSAAIGLLGICVGSAGWTVEAADAGTAKPGAFQVRSGITVLQVFFVANSQSGAGLIANGLVTLTDEAIVIHSQPIPPPMPRAARRAPGRTAKPELKEISITDISVGITNTDDLLRRFREEVAL